MEATVLLCLMAGCRLSAIQVSTSHTGQLHLPYSLPLHIRHLDEFVPPSVFFAVFVLLFLSLSLKISFIFFSHISGRSSFRCFNLILSLRCCVVTQYFWYCYFFLLYDGFKLSCPKLYRDVCVLFCVRSCCSCCMVIVSSSVACLNSFLCGGFIKPHSISCCAQLLAGRLQNKTRVL